MKNILIVGVGFVGSALIPRLYATPGVESIVVFDKEHERLAKIPDEPGIVRFLGDARHFADVTEAMQGCDTVIHLAANPDIARAAKEPTIDFDHGTVLTKNVLEACRVNGVQRLIYFSGSGVYGDCAEIELRESFPCKPISTYGASKLASEAMINAYCAMFGLQATIFRPANIVGPGQTHGVGYDFLRKLKADPTRLEILGNGMQSKSYIHIDDVIGAIYAVLNSPVGKANAVFNVASDTYLSVAEIAEMAVDVAIGDGATVKFNFAGGARGWPGDVPVVRFNCQALKSTGWRPKMNSAEAMRAALEAMWREIGA